MGAVNARSDRVRPSCAHYSPQLSPYSEARIKPLERRRLRVCEPFSKAILHTWEQTKRKGTTPLVRLKRLEDDMISCGNLGRRAVDISAKQLWISQTSGCYLGH